MTRLPRDTHLTARRLTAHALAGLVLLSAAATPAAAELVAWYRFEPGNFLADSSGNNNTLTALAGSAVADVGDVGPSAGSRSSAYFDGISIMKTIANLDLSPYQQIRASWWMKNEVDKTYTPSSAELVFEHSSNFNGNAGGFLVSVNENLTGNQGAAGIKGASGYNLDAYPHSAPDAGHPDGAWEQMAVVYNLASPDAANVVRVYRNGVLLSDQPYSSGLQSTTLAPFRTDAFYVGGRGSPTSLQFKGNIDDLKIESLPESTGPIAYWRFEPGPEFTLDSSGNNHTLTNFGASSSTDVAGGAGGFSSVSFDGTSSYMTTASNLDLSPYRRVRVSYWMKVEETGVGVVWEHSPNFINNPGGIVGDVNDGGIGNGKAGVWTTGGHYNLDNYPHAANPGAWQQVTVEFNRDGVAPDITKVFVNGKLVGRGTTANYTDTVPFLNDIFYLGRRGAVTNAFFQGKVDELKIEEFAPQPLKVFLLAGQSNMMGQYANKSGLPTELQNPQEAVILRADGTWTALQPGRNAATTNDFGPEITFGRDMAAAWPDQNIALVKFGVGSTTLADDWNPDNPGAQYTALLNAVNAAMAELSVGYDAEIAGMLWMQGESDALDLAKAQAYETNLKNFVESVREDLGVGELPFVIGQISDASAWTYGSIVQQAQADAAQALPFTLMISTADLSLLNNHYDAAGQMALGSRFANAMLALIPEPSTACLFGSGSLFLACCAWRRRRRAV